MTALTIGTILAALLWRARPTSETVAPGATASSGTVNGGELDPATFSDAEMYARWQEAQAAVLQELDPAAFSDQEMYSRWRQAQVMPLPEPVRHPDWN